MVRSASKLFYLLSLLLVFKNILLQTELKMTNIYFDNKTCRSPPILEGVGYNANDLKMAVKSLF